MVLTLVIIFAKDMCYIEINSNRLFDSKTSIENDKIMFCMLQNLIIQHWSCYSPANNKQQP